METERPLTWAERFAEAGAKVPVVPPPYPQARPLPVMGPKPFEAEDKALHTWWGLYSGYRTSPEFRALMRIVRERANGHCEVCGTTPFEAIVHVYYDRIGEEDVSTDLAALCSSCARDAEHQFIQRHR